MVRMSDRARDWRERRDTWNQGLRVSPIALDVPVSRLKTLTDFFSILLGWEERAPTEDSIGTAEILAGL